MKVIKEEKDELELLFEKQDLGFANMIADQLLQSKAVKFASSTYDHPLKGNAVIKLIASDPWDELEKAVKHAKEEVKEAEKAFKKLK